MTKLYHTRCHKTVTRGGTMKILIIDDEPLAIEGLMAILKRICPDARLRGFEDPEDTFELVNYNPPDIAFLDIEMRTMNGIDYAQKLMDINPAVNIIFVTGYKIYMEDAFNLHVSGYITKPVTEEKVQKELENLRNPIHRKSHRRIKIHTFGDFEVFIDEIPLKFAYAKSKELFAILVDANGAMCSTAKIIEKMWPDDEFNKHDSYIRNLYADIFKTLKEKGCEDILIKRRGECGIDRNKVSCDYFDFLDGDRDSINSFNEEYMIQYAWGEMTLGGLINRII